MLFSSHIFLFVFLPLPLGRHLGAVVKPGRGGLESLVFLASESLLPPGIANLSISKSGEFSSFRF